MCRVTLWPWEPRGHCPITVSSGEDYLIFGRQADAEKHLADGSIEGLGGWGSCQQVWDKTETLPSTPDSPCRTFLEPGYSHTLTSPQYPCLAVGIRQGWVWQTWWPSSPHPKVLGADREYLGTGAVLSPQHFLLSRPALHSRTPACIISAWREGQGPTSPPLQPSLPEAPEKTKFPPQLATRTPSPVLHPGWWRDTQRAAEKGEGRFSLLTGQRSCDETPG